MTIQAIIFDNDGILVDSEPVWDQVRADMASDAGQSWNEDDHKAVMGVSTAEWAEYMIQRLELNLKPEEVIQQVINRMIAAYREKVPFMPGAIAAVDTARDVLPTGVASGSHPDLLAAVMRTPALNRKFQVVVSADEVPRGKPHPDVYLETARRLGVPAEHCLCIEDSGNGILSGKAAGMTVIAVPDPRFPPSAEKLEQADHVIDSLIDFPALLKEITSQ